MGATIKQIAEMAGVSIGTVDRVIHGRGHVKPETSERIMSICKALDYSPSRAGRQLAVCKQPLKLGIICPYMGQEGIWSVLAQGIEAAIQELKEYNLELYMRHFEYYLPKDQMRILDELAEEHLDGLAIVPMNDPEICARLKVLAAAGTSVVLLNSEVEGFEPLAYVGSDYLSAGRTVAGLFDLLVRGSVLRPLIFYGTKHMLSQQLRVAGLRGELVALGREFEEIGPYQITTEPEIAYEQSYRQLEEHPEANAVFTVGGRVDAVCRAIEALSRQKELVHIGYDLSPTICKHLQRRSITVAIGQEAYRQGYQAIKLLVEYRLFQTPPESTRLITHNEIFIRQNAAQM